MALVVSNGVLVRLLWTRGGLTYAINVYGATGLGPAQINQAFANTLGAAIKSAFATSTWNAQVSSQVSLDKVGVRSIGALNQPEFLDSGVGVAGTATGNFLPPQTALVITLRTALAGKEYRGRTYLCGFSVTANDPNGLATVATTNVAGGWVTAIKDALTANGLTMAVISRKLNIGTPITLILSRNNVWETQRRRSIPGV